MIRSATICDSAFRSSSKFYSQILLAVITVATTGKETATVHAYNTFYRPALAAHREMQGNTHSLQKEGTLCYDRDVSLSFACLPIANLLFSPKNNPAVLSKPLNDSMSSLPTIRQPTISATRFLSCPCMALFRLPTPFRDVYQHANTHSTLPFHMSSTSKYALIFHTL